MDERKWIAKEKGKRKSDSDFKTIPGFSNLMGRSGTKWTPYSFGFHMTGKGKGMIGERGDGRGGRRRRVDSRRGVREGVPGEEGM